MEIIRTFKVDDVMADDTRITFWVAPDHFAIANGDVADPNNVTPAEKLFAEVRMVAVDDSDSIKKTAISLWKQVTPANFPGMNPQIISFLSPVFTGGRNAKGLKLTG